VRAPGWAAPACVSECERAVRQGLGQEHGIGGRSATWAGPWSKKYADTCPAHVSNYSRFIFFPDTPRTRTTPYPRSIRVEYVSDTRYVTYQPCPGNRAANP
jgi:hypothetical protein